MTLELRVVSGARAGSTTQFERAVVTVGRHPASDLAFDPHGDLDVSTRHAELRLTDGTWRVRDLASTNGTFVNGERVTSERALAAGDVITFGEKGPRVEVALPVRRDTSARIAEAVRVETASFKRTMAVILGAVVLMTVTGAVLWQRYASARERELLAARGVAGPSAASDPNAIDLPAIRAGNDPAIAIVASDLDGTFLAGTAFGISPEGRLVTNRHVVQTASGAPARRIRVIYANTTDWLPARIVRVSPTDDLALIELEEPGRFPVVAGLSRPDDSLRVGAPIASIGYPHAVDTPMEGTGLHITARTTMTSGVVSKQLDDVLQIDAYAGKGSSGAPVFDATGRVVGVVYGGAAASAGRIVYAVPAGRLRAFLDAP